MTNTKLALFEGRTIRKIIHNEEWWFAIADVVEVLTESSDVKQYIKKMRSRDKELSFYWGTNCTPLEMVARDGKKRKIMSASTRKTRTINNKDFLQ